MGLTKWGKRLGQLSPELRRLHVSVRGAICSLLITLLMVGSVPRTTRGSIEAGDSSEVHVLFLSSWTGHRPWSQGVLQGISQEIIEIQASTDHEVVLFVEYLDRMRIGSAVSDAEWVAFLQKKYRDIDFDIVLVDSDPTTDILDYIQPWLADVPIALRDGRNVDEHWPYTANLSLGKVNEKTIELALTQNPDAKTVAIIGDRSSASLDRQKKLTEILTSTTPQIEVLVWDQFRLEALEQRVSQLDRETILLFTLVFEDNTGRTFRPVDVVERLVAVASTPMYVLADPLLGSGAIGGHVSSAQNTGRQLLRAAFQLLELAETQEQAHLELIASQTMFDARALRKWQIPADTIPHDAKILYRKPSIWQSYFWESIAALTFIVVLGGLLTVSLFLLQQRRQLSRQLLQANATLERRVAKRTAALHRLATHDDLTGIANRKEFYRQAQLGWTAFQADGPGFCFAILDIDHFKSVNDTYGHPAGDAVLQAFAQAIQRRLSSHELLGRIGGEEFALLMPGAMLDRAIATLEQVRQHVEALSIPIPDRRVVQITVSIGVAESHPTEPNLAAVAQQADRALYDAKRQGRNRVVAAGSAPIQGDADGGKMSLRKGRRKWRDNQTP